MSKAMQNGSLKEAKLSKIHLPHWGVLDSLGFSEAAILNIFEHVPTHAHAFLAAIFQQEFKHPNGIPKC